MTCHATVQTQISPGLNNKISLERNDLVVQDSDLLKPIAGGACRADVMAHRLMRPKERARSVTQWPPGDEIQLRYLEAQLVVRA